MDTQRQPQHPAVQIRHIETVELTRPSYRVVAPASWTDKQVGDAFRETARRWVGYLFPVDQFPVRGHVDVYWFGLSVDDVRALFAQEEGRRLSRREIARLATVHPELADVLRPDAREGVSSPRCSAMGDA